MKYLTRSIVIFTSGILLGMSLFLMKTNVISGFATFIASLIGFLIGFAGE